MPIFISTFLLGTFSIVALDYLWLGFVMKSKYLEALAPYGRVVNGSLNMNLTGAIFSYVFLGLGLVLFVILPNVESSLLKTVVTAFIFGVIVYGVYDFTNLATLKDWKISISILDILWGGVVCALATLIIKWLI